MPLDPQTEHLARQIARLREELAAHWQIGDPSPWVRLEFFDVPARPLAALLSEIPPDHVDYHDGESRPFACVTLNLGHDVEAKVYTYEPDALRDALENDAEMADRSVAS